MICNFCTKRNECNLICSDIYCREFFHEIPFEEIKPGDTIYQVYPNIDLGHGVSILNCISKDDEAIITIADGQYNYRLRKINCHQYPLYRDYHEAKEVANIMGKYDKMLENEFKKVTENCYDM